MVTSFQVEEETVLLELGTRDKLTVVRSEGIVRIWPTRYLATQKGHPVDFNFYPIELARALGKSLGFRNHRSVVNLEFHEEGFAGQVRYNPNGDQEVFALSLTANAYRPWMMLHLSREDIKAFLEVLKRLPKKETG